jgi:hypothetical protein
MFALLAQWQSSGIVNRRCQSDSDRGLRDFMVISRYGRIEEKRQRKRLILAIIGIIGIVVFMLIFGFRLLVGFSLLVDTIRGNTPVTQQAVIILPPVLNPVPIATKSSSLTISGYGQQGYTLILYVNEKETKKITLPKVASFSAIPITLKEGSNSISAKMSDDKGNLSDLSNILTVEFKQKQPTLELQSPEDNTTISGDNNNVNIIGKTETDTTITVNGRFVVISNDNSFNYPYSLNEGDNTLKIEARDQAGNTTTIERKVRYQK